MDPIQPPSHSQSQLQPQPQSFQNPQATIHQTHVQSHSPAPPIPQLQPPPQTPIQNQSLSQTNSQPYPQTLPQQQSLSQMAIPQTQSRLQHSKSTSSGSLSPRASSPNHTCSWARGVSRPPSVLLPRALYDIITASDSSGLPRCTSFLPHMSVAWASSFR